MILVKPSFEILGIYTNNPLALIELAGRTAYKSEDKITDTSAEKFVKMLRDRGHESVIEHSGITIKFIVDRGVSHELVRHRLSAYTQESTRYCNYKGGVTFVIPPWVTTVEPGEYEHIFRYGFGADKIWFIAMSNAETYYRDLLRVGWSPEKARSVLPNSLKTEIVMSTNFREMRHILKLRTSKAAHPQMREIMIPLLRELKNEVPVIFDDIGE